MCCRYGKRFCALIGKGDWGHVGKNIPAGGWGRKRKSHKKQLILLKRESEKLKAKPRQDPIKCPLRGKTRYSQVSGKESCTRDPYHTEIKKR